MLVIPALGERGRRPARGSPSSRPVGGDREKARKYKWCLFWEFKKKGLWARRGGCNSSMETLRSKGRSVESLRLAWVCSQTIHWKTQSWSWRDSSVVSSYRELGFGSQPSSGSSWRSVMLVPGDPTPFSAFHRHQACTWYTDIHVGKTSIHIKNK